MNRHPWRKKTGLAISAILFLLASLETFSGAAQASRITFLTHSLGEQSYLEGAKILRGKEHGGRRAFDIELVREMMLLVGERAEIEEIPFKRGLMLVQSSPDYALFNVNRTEEREHTVKWVGPLQSSITHFYENAKAPTGIKSMEDAKRVGSICVMRGNVHHRYLERQGFTNIYPVNSYASCIDMLILGRVSITPLSNLSALAESKNPEATLVKKTPVKVMESEGYLAFSKNTSDALIEEWQAALDEIKASGRYDELLNLYSDSE